MTKVGIITGNLKKNMTGMGTYSFQLIDYLKEHYQIDLIKHQDGDSVEGCQNLIPRTIPGPYWYLSWSRTLSFTKKTLSKYDIIHNIGQYPIPPSISKKYIITIYDLIPIIYPSFVTPLYAWQSKRYLPDIMKKSSMILSISEYTKEDIIKRYNIDPNKIMVTPLGVSEHFHPYDNSSVESFRKRYNLKNPFVLFVGALEPKKNIPTVLKSFSRCRKKIPSLHLVIAGKKSWKYDEIFALVKSLELENSVRFLEYVSYEELPLLYNAADVFVFPSLYEGFGLPPLEAMKCGTPVIVSNRSSLPEIVGPEGEMVEPNDDEELSQKILKLITNDGLRDEQVSYNLERAKKFTWMRCAKETKKAYDKILNQ